MYNPTEHLAVDEVIVLYKGRVIFRQYIPKKQKIWHQNLQTYIHSTDLPKENRGGVTCVR